MDNPETRENSNMWDIRHMTIAKKTKQNKTKITDQKTAKDEQHGPHQYRLRTNVLVKVKQYTLM